MLPQEDVYADLIERIEAIVHEIEELETVNADFALLRPFAEQLLEETVSVVEGD